MSRLLKCKWTTYNCLKADYSLAQYLPETHLLTKETFWDQLNKHNRIILKPDDGAKGIGIIVVTCLSPQLFEIQVKKRKHRISGQKQTYNYLKKLMHSNQYVVQQFISFAKVHDSLFDIRVMAQLDQYGSWIVTGRLAKLSQKGYIVTNPENEVQFVEDVLRRSTLRKFSPQSLISELDKVALQAAGCISKIFPQLDIIGFDLCLDNEGKVWMIEANFAPQIYWFKELPSREDYNRILQYKRENRKMSESSLSQNKYYRYFYYY